MAYYDKLLTSAGAGKVALSTLIGNTVYPARLILSLN
jgi:hypothetical protein